MSSSAPPPPPSAQSMISAQNAANTQARAQNLVNTTGPTQSTHYTQNANGIMSAKTTLTPAQQALLNANQATGQTALNESAKQLQGEYQKPADVTGATNSLDSGMLGAYVSSMDPFFTQQNEQQDAKLAAMGLNPDSQAAELARMNTQRTQDAAVTGAAAQFLPQAQQMAISAYNLPLQTSEALKAEGISSMAAPNAYTPNTQGAVMQPTAAAGIQNQAYQNQVQQTQAQNSAANAPFSMLAGLAGSALGGPIGGMLGTSVGNMFNNNNTSSGWFGNTSTTDANGNLMP